MYESAFGGEPPKPAAPAALALPASPSLGAPPPVPARGAPPALPSGGPPLAASASGGDAAAAAGKSKQCQRCQTAKAASKVTIQGTPLKLCQACSDLVSSNPDAARDTLRALGVGGPAASLAAVPTGPPQMCDQCNSKPQHARTVVGGTLKTLCATCMADTPHFHALTRYALACVATKNIDEAKASFEELLHISPEHPPTLYNCACVQALQNELDSSLRLLGRALDAGYDNIKQIKKGKIRATNSTADGTSIDRAVEFGHLWFLSDPDLKKVRNLAAFNTLLDNHAHKQKAAEKAAADKVSRRSRHKLETLTHCFATGGS